MEHMVSFGNEKMDKLCSVIANSLLDVSEEPGLFVWPYPHFHPAEVAFRVYPQIHKIIHGDIKSLEKKGFTAKSISQLFRAPSRICNFFFFLGARHNDVGIDERIEVTLKLLEYISHYRTDPFCEDGKNIILNNNDIKLILEKTSLIDLCKTSSASEYKQKLGKLNAALWLYCELLYFGYHSMAHEFHGPYEVNDGEILIVRDYYDLKPEFWSFCQNFQIETITSYEIYSDIPIYFDFFNRSRSSKLLPKYLRKLCLKVNRIEDIDNLSKLDDVLNKIEKNVQDGISYINELEKKKLLEKNIEMFHYVLKPLRQATNKDWKLGMDVESEKMKENPLEATIAVEMMKKMKTLPKEDQIELLKRVFDPRRSTF